MRLKAVSWSIERSEPFLVNRAARRKAKVKAGLRAVFFRRRPTGSPVRPAKFISAIQMMFE